MDFNQITLSGHVGQDPTMRYTPNGDPVCNFRMAVNTRRAGQEETEWFRVTCWGRLAETVGQYVTKGRRVLVSGRLHSRTWTDDDGKDRFGNEVTASTVVFLERATGQQEQSVQPPSSDDATARSGSTPPPESMEVEDLPW